MTLLSETKAVHIDSASICVIGLGYVGLPLALGFCATQPKVIGFDVSPRRLMTVAGEVGRENGHCHNLVLSNDPSVIALADFAIICVPTPVNQWNVPDLGDVQAATALVGRNMKRGCTVVLESTVYPGVTEEIMIPILEKESGFICGADFKVGYSPERVNPGDDEHAINRITKVVAGIDDETTERLAALYSRVAGSVFKARSIKVAEACKVVENTQRDVNIALMNELAMMFERMGISLFDVLEAAGTKWNFHRYVPGLVGGHCISVDPYYLFHRGQEFGYHAQLILTARNVSTNMARYVAEKIIKALCDVGKPICGAKVMVMGVTYKENVPDVRGSLVFVIMHELHQYGVNIVVHDPVVTDACWPSHVRVVDTLDTVSGVDAIIVAVPHDQFKSLSLDDLKRVTVGLPVLLDIKLMFNEVEAVAKGFCYRTL